MIKHQSFGNLTEEELRARLANIKVCALDMDGTIYLGLRLFPFTEDFLKGLEQAGKRFVFLTNNSSKNGDDYYKKLTNMGLEVKQEQIYTSGDATIEYLKSLKPNANIYLMGTKSLMADFEKAGFRLTEKNPDYVVLGFDLDFNYERFDKAARMIRQGIPFIATHPDFNCPMEGGDMLPDCGALSAAFTASTGVKPKVIGKPNSEMLNGILSRAGIKKDELCIMGDRLMTDIRMGQDFGILSILVLTGEAKTEDIKPSGVIPDVVLDRNIDLLNYLG